MQEHQIRCVCYVSSQAFIMHLWGIVINHRSDLAVHMEFSNKSVSIHWDTVPLVFQKWERLWEGEDLWGRSFTMFHCICIVS